MKNKQGILDQETIEVSQTMDQIILEYYRKQKLSIKQDSSEVPLSEKKNEKT